MKMLYLDCHSVLAYDEIKLFTEMGHEVFSLGGSYFNTNAPADPKRPEITGPVQQHLMDIVCQCSKDNIHPELIEWADVIYVMHRDDWIINNWAKMKQKKVIWRTIGQSVPLMEHRLALCRSEGMKIVRYSPKEESIMGYIGHDAVIRFYKDESEFCGWVGNEPSVCTIAQAMKKRGKYCGFDIFNTITEGFPRVVYGPGNEDTGCDGGQLSYEDLKTAYRKHRVYFYTGTYPASYTLNFIEALMTGIPIVAIGDSYANLAEYIMNAYEIPSIIQNGVNGYYSDDPDQLKGWIKMLLEDPVKAKEIGENGRKTAIELFGKQNIKKLWEVFYATI